MDRIKELLTNPTAYIAAGCAVAGATGFLTGDKLGWLALLAGGIVGMLSRKVNPAAPSTAELRGIVESAIERAKS